MAIENIEQITLAVVDALHAESIPYLLAGSISSSFYGIPRSTADADFVIHLGDQSIFSLQQHLPEHFHINPQIEFETVTATRRNVIDVMKTDFKVELFRLSDDAHDQERFARRAMVRLFDRDVYLPTPEDVIIMKLRWMREKDRSDVRAVVAVQGDALDWPYLTHWTEIHGTHDLLEEIRASIPPLDD